jgi:hypothetical protein
MASQVQADELPNFPSFWDVSTLARRWKLYTTLYLAVILIVTFLAVYYNFELSKNEPALRCVVVIAGIFLAVLPTLYWWRLSNRFEKWTVHLDQVFLSEFRKKNPGADEKEWKECIKRHLEYERKIFELNREHAKAFWAMLVAVFTVFLLKSKLGE